jgi:hypothetical protein
MRLRCRTAPRRGATLTELALTITAFLALVLGSVDLGIATFRLHVLSQAARMGVRQAIVHGPNAPSGWNGGTWGPSTYTAYANASDAKAQSIAPYLVGLNASQVQITMQWPGTGSPANALEQPVSVTLTTTWTPMLGFIFGSNSYTLRASSEMPIAH